MKFSEITGDTYNSADRNIGLLSKLLPTISFYLRAAGIVIKGSLTAKRGMYDRQRWDFDSQSTAEAMEAVGGKIEIDGLDNLRAVNGPCVIIANHMSTLETFLLPSIVLPFKDVTFIVKKSLTTYPIFGHIMVASEPITVSRTNPREDLKTVFNDGAKVLESGRSIIVFPQTTRREKFDPSSFNTIGVKLAAKAGVPIVPLALHTAFWGNGKIVKEFGRIYPSKTARFSFGPAIHIDGRGAAEQKMTIEFIAGRLAQWEQDRT